MTDEEWEKIQAAKAAAKETTTIPKGKPKSTRFEPINSFVDGPMRDLNGNDVKIWVALWRDTKPNGFAQISQSQIARLSGVSVDTVYRGMKRLSAAGLVRVIRKGNNLTGESTLYQVKGGA